jgi:hypothetical protein
MNELSGVKLRPFSLQSWNLQTSNADNRSRVLSSVTELGGAVPRLWVLSATKVSHSFSIRVGSGQRFF